MNVSIGIDIGGTKCALSVGECASDSVRILHREEFPTKGRSWREVLEEFSNRIIELSNSRIADVEIANIGISCGGPLDSEAGVIMSPPNLPGWDDVPVVKFFADRFKVPVRLQNDANACACAEWKFGAGRGTRNMVFMTFGTGLGAGIVIDGRLYSGTNDNAGEIGHIRLAPTGPVGYNKEGSAEGFCSGAGMTKLALIRAKEQGVELPDDFDTKELFRRIDEGDAFCTAVFRESAAHLGTILAYVIDILNPEVIVLGGVFMRQRERFMKEILPIIEREALPFARKVCRITGAALSENIGDYAALAVANMAGENSGSSAIVKQRNSFERDCGAAGVRALPREKEIGNVFNELYGRYPRLKGCVGEIGRAFELLLTCYRNGGKVLTCGNGGSAADAEHIVGELLKKFRKHRDIDSAVAAKLPPELVAKLEGALPAVSLVSMSGILTAFANDVTWESAFAQQVYGLGNSGDVLIALSTSGNSENCVNAALVAKAKGMTIVSMTGEGGGRLAELADAAIRVPETETYKIQELHLPVYHALCAAVEETLFPFSKIKVSRPTEPFGLKHETLCVTKDHEAAAWCEVHHMR